MRSRGVTFGAVFMLTGAAAGLLTLDDPRARLVVLLVAALQAERAATGRSGGAGSWSRRGTKLGAGAAAGASVLLLLPGDLPVPGGVQETTPGMGDVRTYHR